MTKLLVITTPAGQVQARFQQQKGRWTCIEADQQVSWIRLAAPEVVRIWIERNGYRHEWRTEG